MTIGEFIEEMASVSDDTYLLVSVGGKIYDVDLVEVDSAGSVVLFLKGTE